MGRRKPQEGPTESHLGMGLHSSRPPVPPQTWLGRTVRLGSDGVATARNSILLFCVTCRKTGSSGRTRTYNPPVNSCADGKTGNYRRLRLILKIHALSHFQERLSTANFEGGSLKNSPKYFPASPRAPTLGTEPHCDADSATAKRPPQFGGIISPYDLFKASASY